jgi:hypothetical protein
LNIGGWITGAAGAITVPGSLTTAGFTSTGIDDNATSTAITIDASENVGIGTSSPSAKVDIFDSGAGNANSSGLELTNYDYGAGETGQSISIEALVRNDGGGTSPLSKIIFGKDSDYSSAAARDGNIQFYTNQSNVVTEAMRITSAGNVGIGTTPESWSSTREVLQIGNAGAISSLNNNNYTEFLNNTYNDGGWKYINTDEAQRLLLDNDGAYLFMTAPSGTADSAISWTTGFEITNGGFPKSERTYANTTASSANMVVESAYTFARSVSSAKHKKDIETMQDSYADVVLQMRPVWFKSKCDLDNPDWGYWGLIAEEVAELDPRLVFWQENEYIDKEFSKEVTIPAVEEQLDSDGNIVVEAQPERTETVTETEKVAVPLDTPEAEGVQYDRIIPHLINLLKRQDTTIKDLTTRIEALEV